MLLMIRRHQLMLTLGIMLALAIFGISNFIYFKLLHCTSDIIEPSEAEVQLLVEEIFSQRNQAILNQNLERLKSLYDRNTKYGVWTYEHQAKKLQYLKMWGEKQGAEICRIKSIVKIRHIRPRSNNGLRITLLSSTEYQYSYNDDQANSRKKFNLMRIGSYHSLDLIKKEQQWLIRREWFTDPFADALELNQEKIIAERDFILAQNPPDLSNLNPRRIKAVAYADRYCGAAANDEIGFHYNPKYKNYNYYGGDCANFASQVLHEGGGFRKTKGWNYGKGASKAWVNAGAFNQYMLNSGRASKLAYGTYSQVLKASFKLLPGDYIAYEKKGKVTHISVVTGVDSKGFALTNSHNADRYRVPWDLGYGNKGIKFWLVRVHY
ncbi:MAG TPA: amidase domain-containing protein [Bacillota bacterium]|jgi:hypothetical protein|nr:amidase domain-containing protein [Bacillota bacterium]HOL09761.1 amidase domain-containing protein [Bacillota bacterium]HPO98559.1 amidase domain-containing protein [Bacillota bacterium]